MAAALAQGPGLDWVQSLDGMDNETAGLMVELYLEEIAELQATAGEQNGDGAVAQELFGVALRQNRANRAARTPPQPQPVRPPPPAPAQPRVPAQPPLPVSPPVPALVVVPEVVRATCNACTDRFPVDELCRGPCGHNYCAEDVQHLFSHALQDEVYYPPRCCSQAFDFEAVRNALGEDLAFRFERMRPELDDKARLYCHDGTCSTYISIQGRAEGVGQCGACNQTTCITCKKAAHPGQPCPEDKDAQALVELAKQEGWQKCNGCGNMVELSTGCNHMTCRCKAQFCYVCGETWKTCRCPQFDENRLLERARVVAVREGHGDGAAVVGAVADHLRLRHNCGHENYDRVNEAWQTCDGCQGTLRTHIFRCTRCRQQMCYRCRYHR